MKCRVRGGRGGRDKRVTHYEIQGEKIWSRWEDWLSFLIIKYSSEMWVCETWLDVYTVWKMETLNYVISFFITKSLDALLAVVNSWGFQENFIWKWHKCNENFSRCSNKFSQNVCNLEEVMQKRKMLWYEQVCVASACKTSDFKSEKEFRGMSQASEIKDEWRRKEGRKSGE